MCEDFSFVSKGDKMKPRVYASLTEKHNLVKKVDYGDTFIALTQKLEALRQAGYVFRGQEDAFWPIVSSAQRAYAEYLNIVSSCGYKTESKYTEYLTKLLNYAKREEWIVPRRSGWGALQRPLYDHEIWGWLQHFSYFTPFIDFTNNPWVAMFMATYKLCFNSNPPTMFSIYAMNANENCCENEPIRMEEIIKSEQGRLSGMAQGLPSTKGVDVSDKTMFSYKEWKDFSFALVHKDGTLKPWDEELGRERIASQNGLFVYLGKPEFPLEEYASKQNKMNKGEDGVGCYLQQILCFDIPTSLAPCALEWCRRKGYTLESLGLVDQHIDDCMKSLGARFREIVKEEQQRRFL